MKTKTHILRSYWKDTDRLLSLVSDSTKPFEYIETGMLYELEAEGIMVKNPKEDA